MEIVVLKSQIITPGPNCLVWCWVGTWRIFGFLDNYWLVNSWTDRKRNTTIGERIFTQHKKLSALQMCVLFMWSRVCHSPTLTTIKKRLWQTVNQSHLWPHRSSSNIFPSVRRAVYQSSNSLAGFPVFNLI